MTGRISIIATLATLSAMISQPAFSDSDPYLQPDETWIRLSGEVESVSEDAFILDYGDGIVTVEMDDGDRDADGYKLVNGDKVTVSGMVDDDFYETTSIEASSVYVENIGTYFFASAADEEAGFVEVGTPVSVSFSVLKGTVSEVNEESFVLNTGPRRMVVEVDEMSYNPLDDEGYQKVEVGDLVSVTGSVDNDLFEGRVFEAESVVTLVNS